MKRISIAKTFIIILIILIALFISGSYLMGNMAEKNLQYTIRQFSDKGIEIKQYDKGIFTSSLTLSAGTMEVAKINIIHMPVIISLNNLFNKHLFLFEAFGNVTLYNENTKVSSQEVLVNLNGDVDTRFKIFIPESAVSALKSFNTNLDEDAITGSLLINASDPKVIKAKLRSFINLKNISSNMAIPVKINIGNASLDLDFYFEKSKVSDEISNKTNISLSLNAIDMPTIKSNVENIKVNLKIEPQSISPKIIMQAVFGDPINLLNLINAEFAMQINNISAPSIGKNDTKSTAKNIQLAFSFNGIQDDLQSKVNVVLNELNTQFFSTQKTAFATNLNINKELLFYDIPNLIHQAKQNNLNLTEDQMNQYLLKIKNFLISFDNENLKAEGQNFGILNLDIFKISYGIDNNHNNSFLKNDIEFKNLEWNKKTPGTNDLTGNIEKSNAKINANFNLSNMILGRNSDVIYTSDANIPNVSIKYPNGEFNLSRFNSKGTGNPNDDNFALTLDTLNYSNYALSDIKFDSEMNNLNSFTYSLLVNKLFETSNIPMFTGLAKDENQVYKTKIASDLLIYLIKKGFDIKQNLSMAFPNDNNQKLVSTFNFVFQANEQDNVSNLSSDQLAEYIFNNGKINLNINLPVFLYGNLQDFINSQVPNLPESLQDLLPSILKYIKDNSIIKANDNSYVFNFDYKQGKIFLNNNDIVELIEKLKSNNNTQVNPNNGNSTLQADTTINSSAKILKNSTN